MAGVGPGGVVYRRVDKTKGDASGNTGENTHKNEELQYK